jgi:hypothetical protein
VVDASPETPLLFGWTPEELKGQSVTILMPIDQRDAHIAQFALAVAENRGPLRASMRQVSALHKNRTIFPIWINIESFYLRIEATHRDGQPLTPPQTWAIEMSTTGNMTDRGITPDILPQGAAISVKVNPLFSGGLSGNYTNMVMIDGVRNTSTGQDWQPE